MKDEMTQLVKQLKGIRRELEKISKTLAKDRKNEKRDFFSDLPDDRHGDSRLRKSFNREDD